MSRLEKIKELFADKLKEHIKQQEDIDISEMKIFNIIQDADFTNNKKNVRWIIETLLNDGFLWEDILPGKDSKVYETIVLFEKNKTKLPVEQRSLMNYKTLGDLWTAVKDFEHVFTSKEEKEIIKEIAQQDTKYLYEDENIKIISPLTQFSAQWWGKGTRWCTSAEKNNMFERYANEAPLLILLMSNGDKLQLWKNGDKIQFMNEADKTVEKDYIKQHWTILEPICLWLNDLRFIPDEYLTTEICEKILKKDKNIFDKIPIHLLNQEMCNHVLYTSDDIKSIPEKFIQQEHVDFLRKKNRYNFPIKYINQNDIEQILINSLFVFRYKEIFKHKLDKEMAISILKNPDISVIRLLSILKDNDIVFDKDFYEDIWKKNTWRVYPMLPDEYKTDEKTDNYLINGYSIQFYDLPKNQRNMANFKKILDNDNYKSIYKYNKLNMVNNISMEDEDFLLRYLEITSDIANIPEKLITEKHVDNYKKFIENNLENLTNIPKKYLNESRLLDYLAINDSIISFIPKEFYTKKILLNSNPCIINHNKLWDIFNKGLLDKEVIEHLLKYNINNKIDFIIENTDYLTDINNMISIDFINICLSSLSKDQITKTLPEEKLIYFIQNGYGEKILERLLNIDTVHLITKNVINTLLENLNYEQKENIQQQINDKLIQDNPLLKSLKQQVEDIINYNAHVKIYNEEKLDTFNQEVIEQMSQFKKKDYK